jgi:L-ascorbate metabolism protein UlaG (beta-lactamase superfamily)
MKEFFKQFGSSVSDTEKERLSKSANWSEGKFQNLEKTSIDINLGNLPNLLKRQFTNTQKRVPKQNIPIIGLDHSKWQNNALKFIWYGHSVLLLKLAGKNILFDPMFGVDASPIGPIRTKRFSEDSLAVIDQLPNIDLVLMSHDHYDHLDFASYERLQNKVKAFIVPLGVKRHLCSWGIGAEKVTELDWWQNFKLNDLYIELTPSRHSAGRGLTDRDKSLWGGYVLKTEKYNLIISGDGGYGKHFKQIADKHGPFDFAFIECGQYNKEWHQIHMYPEESVQAALDLKAKIAMPIHWGGFKLSLHDWKEPIERFTKEASIQNLQICTPEIGELINLEKSFVNTNWWENFK